MKYAEPHITAMDMVWVERALGSGWLTNGAFTEEYEKMIASFVGAKYAVSFNSATSALFAAYSSVFKPGDEVWMPPITFVATANAAVNAKVMPIFSDVLYAPHCVPVHVAGVYRDFGGKRVVEDAAHALGSSGPYGKIGNCKKSDVAVFSTHAIKNITTGEGGVATTNSKKHRDNMRVLRDHGRKNGRAVVPGWNLRMTEIQAALGISQLRQIGFLQTRRLEMVGLYRRELGGIIETLPQPEYDTFHHLYVIFTPKRASLQRFLAKSGIETAIHYPLVYSHPAYKNAERHDVDESEEWARTCLSLPLHNNLKDEDIRTVCNEVKKWRER